MFGLKPLAIALLEYIIVALSLLDCNTPYSRSATTDYHLPEIIAGCTLLLFVVLINRLKIKKSIVAKMGAYFAIYFIVVIALFFLSVDKENPGAFLARFLVAFPLLTMIQSACQIKEDHYSLMRKYVNVVFVIAIISLLFWTLGSNLHIINPTEYVKVNWGSDFLYPSYYGLYFERQIDSVLFYKGYRNMGIFCEAPMFSVNLVIAIAVEMFLSNSKNNFSVSNKQRDSIRTVKLIVLITTLVTTITTIGFLALIIIIVESYTTNKPVNVRNRIIKYCSIMIVGMVGLRLGYMIFINKSGSMSWLIRLDDYRAGINAWKMSPIWGNGYGDEIALKRFMSSFRSWNMGYSNSIFTVLAQGGILLLGVYLAPVVWCIYNAIKIKDYRMVFFVSIVILEFIVTIFPYTFIMLMLLSFMLSYCMIMNGNEIAVSDNGRKSNGKESLYHHILQ